MASNINPYNIDGTFPIAGQDNSSQGFRDNFTNIKNNFTYAENEITELQNKSIVTSALSGQTLNNDMAGTQIKRPQLTAWTQSYLNKGYIATGTTVVLDFGSSSSSSNGANFQSFSTAGSPGTINVNFTGWPTSTGSGALGYGVMRVWIIVADTSHTVTLPASVSIGINDIAGSVLNADGTTTITFDEAAGGMAGSGNYIFDFSSIDGGNSYQIFDVSRNRVKFRDPGFYFNTDVNPTLLIGYNSNTINTAIANEQGFDTVSVLGSFNSVGIGNVWMGNIAFTQTDEGLGAGYSVTGLRGNLVTGSVSPLLDGDLVGYFNSLQNAGTGTPTLATGASLAFYARGSNYAQGIGSNVAIYTRPDGAGLSSYSQQFAQVQAVGIENDQSSTFYGNVTVKGNINTTGRKVDTGFTVQSFVSATTNGTTYTVPSNINTVIVDSDGLHANVTYANIILPTTPVHGQQVKMVFLSNITAANAGAGLGITGGANIYGSNGRGTVYPVKYIPGSPTANITGNTTITLTFVANINGNVVNTWYRY